MVRAFVAVKLGREVESRIIELVAQLKEARADVRWVGRESIHLTLRFLGDVEEARVAGILEALKRRLSGLHPLCIETGGLGAFPSLGRPRVLWVGCKGNGLRELGEATEAAMVGFGFARETRPFTPHVTLGRMRSLRDWDKLRVLIAQRATESFGSSEVSEVILFRSTLTPEGARYSRLGSVALEGGGTGPPAQP